MGYLDDVKKRISSFQAEVNKNLGGSNKSKGSGGGHRLGGESTSVPVAVAPKSKWSLQQQKEPTLASKVVKAKFGKSGPLGMTLSKDEETKAAFVASVAAGGAAEKAGVEKGDVVVGIDNVDVATYDEFMATFRGADHRPVTFSLTRIVSAKDARREAQAKAALERDGAWAKRVASRPQGGRSGYKGPSSSEDQGGRGLPDGPMNPETEAAWKAAQERHAAEAKHLGYDPYKSLSTGSGAGGAAVAAASSSSSSATTIPPSSGTTSAPDDSAAYDRASEEADVVVQALVANGDKAAVKTCLSTVLKLMENAISKDDDKFKRVRLANPNIQSRILAVQGGLEALVTAGFQLTTEDNEETALLLPNDFDRARCRAVADALTSLKAQFD